MSFRTQLALLVALLVAVAAGVAGVTARVSAERELVQEIDGFLIDRSGVFTEAALPRPGRAPRPFVDRFADPRRRPGDTDLAGDDSVVQIVAPSGQVVISQEGGASLPVRADVDAPYALEDVSVDGRPFRMISRPMANGFTVQVARDLAETNRALDGLDRRLVAGVVLVSAVAAALGWLLARRLTRPIVELTAATEQVAVTKQFDQPVAARGTGEVGRLADSFNTMLAELGTSRAQQQRLIEDAGHELRTPLTSLRTNVELLQNPALRDDDRAHVLARLRSESSELSTLIDEVVDLGTDSRTSEPFVACDLAEIADSVAQRSRRRHDRIVELEGVDSAPVHGQPQMLGRAMTNLVDNALKFDPEGAITMRVSADGVEVLDRGPGVPAAEIDLIFDRFHRAATSRAVSGSGLGLSIVQQVAQAHGGSVQAANRPGGGAIIGFRVATTPPAS